MGLPLELITMLGSAMVGGMLKIWGMKNETQRMQGGMMIQAMKHESGGFKEAREFRNARFEVTRQLIALACIFAVIVLPKILVFIDPTIPVSMGWTEFKPGFLFFTEQKEVMAWHTINQGGLVITPLDTHTVYSIMGLYMGASTVGSR